jgi:hypothetical protein
LRDPRSGDAASVAAQTGAAARRSGDWRGAALAAGVHLLVVALHVALSGVRIVPNRWFEWNNLWSMIPVELVAAHPWRTLLNLHGQPPLWNLFGAFMYGLFGNAFMSAIHVVHVLLGAALVAMLYALVARLTGRPRVALALAVLFALNPALVLYEAWGLYAMATAFLALAACGLVSRYEATSRWACIAAAYGVCVALVMTRSLYAPLLLAPLAAAAVSLAPPGRRARAAAIVLVLSLPVAGWIGKNAVRFGVYGMSSWLGQNVWRVVSSNYSQDELGALAARGVIAPVTAAHWPFKKPAALREWGFDAVAGVPELDGDDLNNVNVIAISRTFGASAWQLLLHDPVRYARGAARAFYFYTSPTARHANFYANRLRMEWHERVYDGWLLAADWLRLPDDRGRSGALFAGLLAAATALGLHRARAECRAAGVGLAGWARAHPTLCLLALLATYNLVVGCLIEFGDNERFRFDVEAHYWALFAWSFARRPAAATLAAVPAPATG